MVFVGDLGRRFATKMEYGEDTIEPKQLSTISIAASPASANVHVQAIRRPSHARVRVRGTDIRFSNKPPYCFLFIFLPSFCFFSFFPSFSLLAMSGSFLCCFNSPATPAADEIAIKKEPPRKEWLMVGLKVGDVAK